MALTGDRTVGSGAPAGSFGGSDTVKKWASDRSGTDNADYLTALIGIYFLMMGGLAASGAGAAAGGAGAAGGAPAAGGAGGVGAGTGAGVTWGGPAVGEGGYTMAVGGTGVAGTAPTAAPAASSGGLSMAQWAKLLQGGSQLASGVQGQPSQPMQQQPVPSVANYFSQAPQQTDIEALIAALYGGQGGGY